MPSPYVAKVAAMAGVSTKTAEVFWKEAKTAASKSYDKSSEMFWGTVTKIFKRKASKHLGIPLPEAEKMAEAFILEETKMNNFEKALNLLSEAKDE